jgi:hypothetical protein
MAVSVRSYCLAAALLILGCTPTDPLAGLTSEDKAYLFADSGTNVPFMGQPIDAGPLNCYPKRMNQGYVLIDTADELWLDSIRPSGVERHRVLSVVPTPDGFLVKAKNGVGVNFDLQIDRKDRDLATISWDGAPSEVYRRCPIVGG